MTNNVPSPTAALAPVCVRLFRVSGARVATDPESLGPARIAVPAPPEMRTLFVRAPKDLHHPMAWP